MGREAELEGCKLRIQDAKNATFAAVEEVRQIILASVLISMVVLLCINGRCMYCCVLAFARGVQRAQLCM